MDESPPTTERTPPGRKNRRGKWLRWLLVGGVVAAALLVVLDRALRPATGPAAEVSIQSIHVADATRPHAITDDLNKVRSPSEHPLDPAIEVARAGLDYFQNNVRDYEAVFIKQERIGGHMAAEEQSFVKIRQAGRSENGKIPFSVYMRFTQPPRIAGREVIYVDGRNDGKLIAHEGGLLGIATVYLLPTSQWAMQGNRYPITEIGLENLIRRMIEKGERDRQHDECELKVNRSIKVNGHAATEIQIIHPQPRDYFEFHIAKILIDDELNVPVSYEGYLWPEQPGGEPVLLERYQYADLRLNVGLTDEDFDPANDDYHFHWVNKQ